MLLNISDNLLDECHATTGSWTGQIQIQVGERESFGTKEWILWPKLRERIAIGTSDGSFRGGIPTTGLGTRRGFLGATQGLM